jgi:hypothetical protein
MAGFPQVALVVFQSYSILDSGVAELLSARTAVRLSLRGL